MPTHGRKENEHPVNLILRVSACIISKLKVRLQNTENDLIKTRKNDRIHTTGHLIISKCDN